MRGQAHWPMPPCAAASTTAAVGGLSLGPVLPGEARDPRELGDVGIDLGIVARLDCHEGGDAFVAGDDRIVALDGETVAGR